MAGETTITLVGNLTADPDLRFIQSGAAVASFTVASTPRNLNRETGNWEDGEPLFMRCNVWRQVAENVTESLRRGSRVVVTGRLKQRSFETKEGEKRTIIELDVEEIGASLKYATVEVRKVERSGGQQQQQRPQSGGYGGGQQGNDDPWGQQYPPEGRPQQGPSQRQPTPGWGSQQGASTRQVREDLQTGGMGREWHNDSRGGFADEPPF